MPSAWARATAWARLRAPSFRNSRPCRFSTVLGEMPRSRAVCFTDFPSAMDDSICDSLRLRATPACPPAARASAATARTWAGPSTLPPPITSPSTASTVSGSLSQWRTASAPASTESTTSASFVSSPCINTIGTPRSRTDSQWAGSGSTSTMTSGDVAAGSSSSSESRTTTSTRSNSWWNSSRVNPDGPTSRATNGPGGFNAAAAIDSVGQRESDYPLRAHEPPAHGHRDRVSLVLDPELAEDALFVVLDGLVTDTELPRDLTGREPGADQVQDRQLPGRQDRGRPVLWRVLREARPRKAAEPDDRRGSPHRLENLSDPCRQW